MARRTILFDVTATGTFDGVTNFLFPPLPAPSPVTGIVTIPINGVALGLIDPQDLADKFTGQGGYWLRTIAINSQNASVARFIVSLVQPKPSVVYASNSTLNQPIIINTPNAAVNAQPYIRRGPYVPGGWIISIRADNNIDTAVVGPYQCALEFETLPQTADAARAVRSQEFQAQSPTLVQPTP